MLCEKILDSGGLCTSSASERAYQGTCKKCELADLLIFSNPLGRNFETISRRKTSSPYWYWP